MIYQCESPIEKQDKNNLWIADVNELKLPIEEKVKFVLNGRQYLIIFDDGLMATNISCVNSNSILYISMWKSGVEDLFRLLIKADIITEDEFKEHEKAYEKWLSENVSEPDITELEDCRRYVANKEIKADLSKLIQKYENKLGVKNE